MARYDGGWGRPQGYDAPFRPYGPPRPTGRPGGQGRGGFQGYDPDFGGRGGGPGGGLEELLDEGTIYGPARYGLGPYYERLRRRRRSDEELKEEVEEALFYDTWVDADAVTVEVRDGIVTLRGELPDYDEIRYATDDVWDVEGVRGVRSELTVRGERRPAPAPSPASAAGAAQAGAGKERGRKKAHPT